MTINEFHNICPLENIPSVLQFGILSHERAERIGHRSIALETVQTRRAAKRVPGGLSLHEYANVYFHARNPMMFRRRDQAQNICVLKISSKILEISNVVVADQNAASDYARFFDPSQINQLKLELIYARDWRHPGDQIAEWRHSSAKCAEVLVANKISPNFLLGAYVVNQAVENRLRQLEFNLPIVIDSDLFFH